ncbi:MAG: nitroreductase family protein [Planctomycetes bacterium]|nr:nitroreductase family protein [Planctomycetota bacterium]
MDFAELVKTARTIRRFDESKPLIERDMMALVDMVRLVPCGANAQTLRYKIILDKSERGRLFPNLAWAGALKDWDGPAEGERPTGYIIILSEKNMGLDTGIAAQTIQLAAADMGIGTCMMGAIQRDKIKEVFSIPENMQVHLVLALGRPVETVVIEPMPESGAFSYWRSEDGVHHVPKRALEDILL